MKLFLVLSQSFLLFWIQAFYSKPVPSVDIHQEGCNQNQSQDVLARVHRSIPDIDAVNPAYLDVEGLPDQEESVDHQKAISPFALTDQLTNFFRGKSVKNEPKTPQKSPHREHVSGVKEDEAAVNGGLSSDEQEECFRQQNLEPPLSEENLQNKKWSKSFSLGEMPIMDVAQGLQPSYVRSDVLKSGKHFKTNKVDKGEVYSLYSNPEKTDVGSKVNVFRQNTSDEFNIPERVYKPVGVVPQFPVYDEDIDFHPDPLQGILDDKYWLDPLEQEAVIRKYIDLAANNMMPPDLQVVKRSALKNPEVKNANIRLDIKDSSADGKCPCKEVVACEDCSKGKARKSNHSASIESSSNDDKTSFGRKLLWIHKDDDEHGISQEECDSSSQQFHEPLSLEGYQVDIMKEENENELKLDDSIESYSSRKLLSLNIGDIGNEDDEMGEDKGVFNAESNQKLKIGRSILWYYEDDEESYDDSEDDKQEFLESERPISNENVPKFESYENDPPFQSPLPDGQGVVENSGVEFKKNGLVDVIENKNSLFGDMPNKPPGLYTPNKLANILQKPGEHKPKEPKNKPTKVDPWKEFRVMRNETFINASRESAHLLTTRDPNRNEKKAKFWFSSKGRRSNPDTPIIKSPPLVPLFQSADELGGSGTIGENKTATNSSQTLLNSTQQTNVSINATTDNWNMTTVEPKVRTTTEEITSTSPKFISDEEESEDAKVANDIVESVISESEKGSVLGHNLGLCRRNESLMSVNFGRIVPETEKIFKLVSDCVMFKLKDHLAKKSCILLDAELLEFLKWIVLSGESFKDYKQKMRKYYDYVPTTVNMTTTTPSNNQQQILCEPDQSFVSNISIADIQ